MNPAKTLAVVKGAGDLATGVGWRLFRCGLDVIMTEIESPLVVRRTVAFAEAVYTGTARVEGVEARRAESAEHAVALVEAGIVPVLVDPGGTVVRRLRPTVVVDAVMAKRNLGTSMTDAPLVIGLGPGFTAGLDVHAVVETKRGHRLGRVVYSGGAAPDTGIPGPVMGYTKERLLRAPSDGVVAPCRSIGQLVEKGEVVAWVDGSPVRAELSGLVRGMIRPGIWVRRGTKIGDIDPRGEEAECFTISDKALAVAGGVLEAVFSFLAKSKSWRQAVSSKL
ncbi:MAG: EF2563 family selenium-dependent molybdenum hydroxylase system protein [Peptococcaceae bacterium]|nr:EF2563 family selenium-dependent molybdenum hydroxylase system protein [Peptococcaceae bacterium]